MELYKRIAFILSLGIMGIGLVSFSTTKQAEAQSPDTEISVATTTPTPNNGEEDLAKNESNMLLTFASKSTDESSSTPSDTPTPTPLPPNDLVQDKYPEINELVKAYYLAKLDCSIESFEDIVTDTSSINVDDLMLKTEYIKNYENITCYTKWLDTEIKYVVYVAYDLSFPTIDTLGPSLDEMYITEDETGKLRIYLGVLSDETTALLDEYRESPEVVALIENNNLKVEKAIESDESLMEFYVKLAQIEAGL